MALSLCSSSVANTGELACDKSRGVAKKFLIYNGTLNSGDLADAETLFNAIVAKSKLSKSAAEKVFVLNEVQEIANNSEQNVEGTLGLGYKQNLREGRPAYTAKIFGGGDLLKRLRQFNNQTVRILEIDANDVLWAYKSGTNARGFQAKLFFSGNTLATGQNVEEGVINVTISIMSVSEYFDSAQWADFGDYNIEDIVSLIDVPLAFVSNSTNVHQISMKIADSNLVSDYNIFDDYGTTIATLDANFSATSSEDGALAITSITANSTLKTLAVTYDNTAYGNISAGTITLTPPTPTQLDAADVTGVELVAVTYTKP